MTQKRKRVTLIHNENAGGAGQSRSELAELISRAGFAVACFSNRKHDLEKALDERADIVAIAGGDGTVAKVASRIGPNTCPIAVLPLGTANNIAKSLGIGRPTVELVAGWHIEKHMAFYPIGVTGPWGRCRIIEGIGFGAIEQAIAELPRKTSFGKARGKYAEAALEAPAEELKLRIDDEVLTGSFTAFEVAKFPFVGPNLHLAPGVDIGEPRFAICSVGDAARERQALAKWFSAPHAAPAPFSVRTAGRLEVVGRFRRARIEGRLWSRKEDGRKEDGQNGEAAQIVVLETEPEPLFFVVP